MSKKQIIGYVLLTLIIVTALVVGGYALYRLGYSHGLRVVTQLHFEKRIIPDFHRRMLPDLWNYRGNIGYPILLTLPRLLSTVGILVLVVLAVIGLVKLLQPNHRMRELLPEERASTPASTDQDSQISQQ